MGVFPCHWEQCSREVMTQERNRECRREGLQWAEGGE